MNRLHLMTTGQQGRETLERTLPELAMHVDRIHLREPHWSAQELVTCIELLMKRGVPAERLIVHDRLDVALVTGIGIQLTTRSIPVDRVRRRFPELRIGQSVHSLTEAAAAEQAGADYVMYGHIFETGLKTRCTAAGTACLKTGCRPDVDSGPCDRRHQPGQRSGGPCDRLFGRCRLVGDSRSSVSA